MHTVFYDKYDPRGWKKRLLLGVAHRFQSRDLKLSQAAAQKKIINECLAHKDRELKVLTQEK
jgi:hypothetical protein